jgi:hypothetical protein
MLIVSNQELFEHSISFLPTSDQLTLTKVCQNSKKAVYNQDLYRRILVASGILIDPNSTCKEQVDKLERNREVKILFEKAKAFYDDKEKTVEKLYEVNRLLDVILKDLHLSPYDHILNAAKVLKAELFIQHRLNNATHEEILSYLKGAVERGFNTPFAVKGLFLIAQLRTMLPLEGISPEDAHTAFVMLAEHPQLNLLEKAICQYYQSFRCDDKKAQLIKAHQAFKNLLQQGLKVEKATAKVYLYKIRKELHLKVSFTYLSALENNPLVWPVMRSYAKVAKAVTFYREHFNQKEKGPILYENFQKLHQDRELPEFYRTLVKFYLATLGREEDFKYFQDVANYPHFYSPETQKMALYSKLVLVEGYINKKPVPLTPSQAFRHVMDVFNHPLEDHQWKALSIILQFKMALKGLVSLTPSNLVLLFNEIAVLECPKMWILEAFYYLHVILFKIMLEQLAYTITSLFHKIVGQN